VHSCKAELILDPVECIQPRPVPSRAFQFLPPGSVTLHPEDRPTRREGQVIHHHLRQEVDTRQDAASVKIWGGEEQAARSRVTHDAAEQARARYWARHPAGRQVLDALFGGQSSVHVRAVLETSAGTMTAREVRVPPLLPFEDRLNLARAEWSRRTAARDRKSQSRNRVSCAARPESVAGRAADQCQLWLSGA
jgi:hypothetical protein